MNFAVWILTGSFVLRTLILNEYELCSQVLLYHRLQVHSVLEPARLQHDTRSIGQVRLPKFLLCIIIERQKIAII